MQCWCRKDYSFFQDYIFLCLRLCVFYRNIICYLRSSRCIFSAKNYLKQVPFLCYRLCGCQTDYSLQVPFFLLKTMWSRFFSSATDCVVVRQIIHYRSLFSCYKLCEAGSFSLLQTVWLSDRLFITGSFFPAKNYGRI